MKFVQNIGNCEIDVIMSIIFHAFILMIKKVQACCYGYNDNASEVWFKKTHQPTDFAQCLLFFAFSYIRLRIVMIRNQ